MEFGTQYLTYDEYREFGGTLEIMPFNLYELKARNSIDIQTMLRLKNKNVPIEVKRCVFELVEGMAFDGNYKDAKPDIQEQYINNIIYNDLVSVIFEGIPLLYRGV